MTDCVVLSGSTRTGPTNKQAGSYRIATQMRDAGFSCQVIDISGLDNYKLFFKYIENFITDKTIWLGISNVFLDKICGVSWPTIFFAQERHIVPTEDQKQKLTDFFSTFTTDLKSKYPDINLCYSDAGKRISITEHGWTCFQGFVDNEIVEFTHDCVANKKLRLNIYKKEYDAFNTSKIHWLPQDVCNNEKVLPIEISRGCIFKCAFCAFPLNGKKKMDYIKDGNTLKQELIYNYDNYGITDYIFTDDTLNDSVEKLLDIKKVLDSLPFRINFVSYLRLDLMVSKPEMADILADMGMISAQFGIETSDKQDGLMIGKGMDFQKQIDYLAKIKQTSWKNITSRSLFIMGFPNDSWEKIYKLEEWMRSDNNPLDECHFVTLTITHKQFHNNRHIFVSSIDKNYEQLGYKFTERNGEPSWYNHKSGLYESDLMQYQYKVNPGLIQDFKYTGFRLMDMINMGIDKQDLITMSKREISEKYDLDAIKKQVSLNYYRNLLKYKPKK